MRRCCPFMSSILLAAAVIGSLATPSRAAAQSDEELAKQTQNPVASLISVPLQGNWDFGLGDRDATGTLLNVQPVMPFGVSQSTNVILRVIMPLTSQPGPGERAYERHGRHPRDRVLLAGEIGQHHLGRWTGLPAASGDERLARLGEIRYRPFSRRAHPARAWTVGTLFNQIWSVSGANDRADVNSTFLQPFANYNLGGGLSVGVSAEATGNWEADEAGRRRSFSTSAR